MTAPRSSLVSQFLPPPFFDLCLHVGEHDDRAITVPACVVRGSHWFTGFDVFRFFQRMSNSSVNSDFCIIKYINLIFFITVYELRVRFLAKPFVTLFGPRSLYIKRYNQSFIRCDSSRHDALF
jgi:hypothetical protein